MKQAVLSETREHRSPHLLRERILTTVPQQVKSRVASCPLQSGQWRDQDTVTTNSGRKWLQDFLIQNDRKTQIKGIVIKTKQTTKKKKKNPTFITRFAFSLKLCDHSPMEKGNFLVQHIAKSTPYWIKKERREERKAGGKTAIFILLIKQNNKEVPLQHRGLRIHRCRRAGSIPDLGTSTCWGYGQHTNQPRRIGGWLFILTNGFPYVIFNRRSHSIFTNSMYIPPYTNTGTL